MWFWCWKDFRVEHVGVMSLLYSPLLFYTLIMLFRLCIHVSLCKRNTQEHRKYFYSSFFFYLLDTMKNKVDIFSFAFHLKLHKVKLVYILITIIISILFIDTYLDLRSIALFRIFQNPSIMLKFQKKLISRRTACQSRQSHSVQ